jgi:MazG family protein
VARLRGPQGCPWDAQQTDDTIKIYLLEEAYEVLDALEMRTPEDVCQELGDLLFQIVFLTRLAEERGEFNLLDVLERVIHKMVHRHPHVFGSEQMDTPAEVAKNWARIKAEEEGDPKTPSSQILSIPSDLPALMRAHRLLERMSGENACHTGDKESWNQVEQRFEHLRMTLMEQDRAHFGKAMGDLLFHLVDVSRRQGLNAEHLLREANLFFVEQVVEMENEQGLDVKSEKRKPVADGHKIREKNR